MLENFGDHKYCSHFRFILPLTCKNNYPWSKTTERKKISQFVTRVERKRETTMKLAALVKTSRTGKYLVYT